MAPWIFPIALQPDSCEPVYLQITRAISADILRGRLAPGTALPGSRTLAKTLGVHRNTVLAAYRELQAQGWTEPLPRSTRVSAAPPLASAWEPGALREVLGFPLEPAAPPTLCELPRRPGTLTFGTGLPDLRLMATEELARAYARALRNRSLLGYGDPKGEHHLRTALASLLSGLRGLTVAVDQLMVVGGSQMALDLVARTLFRPGDRVAVEDPGYAPAWTTLRYAGVELVPIRVDAGGLRVDLLEAELGRRPVRALYCTPHHQFPTTVTLAPDRRRRLLELARLHRMAVLEDDYDFEFPFEGSPAPPLASADQGGVVVYMGSLSKVVAPGLRLGFVAGPRALVDALAMRRYAADRQGDQVLERAMAELLEDGLVQRHVRKMLRIYQTRRTVLAEALERELGSAVSFTLPTGGMSLWLSADPALDVEAWAAAAERHGVQFYPGRHFDFRGRSRPNLRLGFSTLGEDELLEGVRRLQAALREDGVRSPVQPGLIAPAGR
jgi:GntR family transcriptional regulator/MocR family aminotransferase